MYLTVQDNGHENFNYERNKKTEEINENLP